MSRGHGRSVLVYPITIGRGWTLLLLLTLPVVLVPMRRSGASRRRLVAVALLILYAVSVLAVTQFPIRVRPPSFWQNEPWWGVLRWIPFEVPPVGFVLNVVMFVPLGVLVPLLWPRTDALLRLTAWAACASGALELAQFVLWVTVGSRRTVDINDLISNTAGAVLGLLLLRVLVPEAARRAKLVA
jgi:glycopeptide antibiotics resistance protein